MIGFSFTPKLVFSKSKLLKNRSMVYNSRHELEGFTHIGTKECQMN
jgi:hypothetical protein